jgi:hypothetical protein
VDGFTDSMTSIDHEYRDVLIRAEAVLKAVREAPCIRGGTDAAKALSEADETAERAIESRKYYLWDKEHRYDHGVIGAWNLAHADPPVTFYHYVERAEQALVKYQNALKSYDPSPDHLSLPWETVISRWEGIAPHFPQGQWPWGDKALLKEAETYYHEYWRVRDRAAEEHDPKLAIEMFGRIADSNPGPGIRFGTFGVDTDPNHIPSQSRVIRWLDGENHRQPVQVGDYVATFHRDEGHSEDYVFGKPQPGHWEVRRVRVLVRNEGYAVSVAKEQS